MNTKKKKKNESNSRVLLQTAKIIINRKLSRFFYVCLICTFFVWKIIRFFFCENCVHKVIRRMLWLNCTLVVRLSMRFPYEQKKKARTTHRKPSCKNCKFSALGIFPLCVSDLHSMGPWRLWLFDVGGSAADCGQHAQPNVPAMTSMCISVTRRRRQSLYCRRPQRRLCNGIFVEECQLHDGISCTEFLCASRLWLCFCGPKNEKRWTI